MADWSSDGDDDVEKVERAGRDTHEDVEWGGRERPEADWDDDPPSDGLDPAPSGGDTTEAPGEGPSDGPTVRGVLATTAVALALIAAGVAIGVGSLTVAALFLTAAVGIALTENIILTIVLGTVFLQGVGFGVAALGYLRYRGLGIEFVRLHAPDRGDLAWTVIGFVGAFGIMIAGNVLMTVLGIQSQGHELGQLGAENPNLLLALIPLSFLLIGPGEELLFRGVIQTAFVDRVGVAGGITATSVIFALIHLPNYGWLEGLPTIGLLFVVSLLFGYVYERTDNLLVPAMVHAAYNAVQFFILYVVLRYGPESMATLIG